jgi:hypothetical protein
MTDMFHPQPQEQRTKLDCLDQQGGGEKQKLLGVPICLMVSNMFNVEDDVC